VRKNPIKERLSKGEPTIGGWIGLDHPGVAEVMADAGFDWLVFDTEHGHFTTTTLRGAMDAVRRTDICPLVRVAANDPTIIKQILELGPEGVVIPMVCSAEQARAAVAACRYPPAGIRGIGGGRASHYGTEFERYLAQANDNILVVVQIEHVAAVRNVDEIARVKGIDCLFVGIMDLSASMGIAGQVDHPDVQAAISKVIAAGKNSGISVGMWCKDEDHAAEMIARGVRFVAYATDAALLASAARGSVRRVRGLLGQEPTSSTT